MTNILPPKVVYQPDIEPDFNSAQISPFHSLSCKSIAGNKVFTLINREQRQVTSYLYPRYTEGGMGVYWIHPDVCPSVCPSVCRQGFRDFLKKKKTISSIHFIPSIYPYGVRLLTPIHFCVSSLICGPLVAKYLPKMGFPELFEKTIGSIHFIPGIYPYGVSLLTPIHFRVPSLIFGQIIFGPLVAKYLAENGVSELFEKAIGSIHFIPGIYRYGVSLLTPIHFRVPSLICGPLVTKCLAGNGVPELFFKNYWLNSFHAWHLSLWGESLDPYTFSCS